MNSQRLLTIAGVLLVVCIIVYGRSFFSRGRPMSPEELADRALNAGTTEEQEAAAVKLAELGAPAKPHLVRVLQESKVPAVRAAAITGLGAVWDYDSMPALLDALDDESLVVRTRAAGAVQRLLQIESVEYRAENSREARRPGVKAYRDTWNKMRPSNALKNWREKLKSQGF